MSKRMRISAEAAVKEILNFANQSDNKMDTDDSDSEDLNDLNGDAGAYNNYCITFTPLVKRIFLKMTLDNARQIRMRNKRCQEETFLFHSMTR